MSDLSSSPDLAAIQTEPASDALLDQLIDLITERQEHAHPEPGKGPDLHCMNLVAYMGEHMAPVLMRLVEAEARALVLTDQAAGRDESLKRVRDLHREYKIYTDCGHHHAEGEPGVVEVNEVGLVCAEGYMYSICRECCTEGGDQTEVCATDHIHLGIHGPFLCPTRRDIDGDPAGDGGRR